jgi:rhodanese-related sulfurtransferase
MSQLPGELPTVDVVEADRLRSVNGPPALIVDVREAGEFLAARVEGSVLLPLSQFLQGYQRLPQDRQLLIFCNSGNRSKTATAWLVTHGYPNSANVAGGIVAWMRAGLPVKRGPIEPGEGGLPSD